MMRSMPGTATASSRSRASPTWVTAMILSTPRVSSAATASRSAVRSSPMSMFGPGLEVSAVSEATTPTKPTRCVLPSASSNSAMM